MNVHDSSSLERMAIAQEAQAKQLERIAALLNLLLQAMADDSGLDVSPATYMDGTPCR